ncbi:MAG: SufE family protein [Methylobacteriaceae bacterium]|nr:SufE family protein [Methylobacteriaceae bacterium]
MKEPAARSDALEQIVADFDLLDDWDDKYRYLIELGRTLAPLPDAARAEANKVRGCASQVWLETRVVPGGAQGPILHLRGDSDAHIVRGLVALALAVYSGRPAAEIAATDAMTLFARLGLEQHLTPQRSNGLRAMIDRIRAEARAALAAHASTASGPAA